MTKQQQVLAVATRLLSRETWYEDRSYTRGQRDHNIYRYLVIIDGQASHVTTDGVRLSPANEWFQDHRSDYTQILPPIFPKDKRP